MFPWKKQEVLMTNSAEQFGIAQSVLKSVGIEYAVKTVNSGSSNRQSGTLLGRVGERVDLEIFYYIYTKKENAEKAKYLIQQAK